MFTADNDVSLTMLEKSIAHITLSDFQRTHTLLDKLTLGEELLPHSTLFLLFLFRHN